MSALYLACFSLCIVCLNVWVKKTRWSLAANVTSQIFYHFILRNRAPIYMVQEAEWAPGPAWTGRLTELFFPQNRVRIPGRPPCSESLYCYVLPANCLVDCDGNEYELYAFIDCLSAINSSYRWTHELLMWDFFLNNQAEALIIQIHLL
jgi:hypothetical protein